MAFITEAEPNICKALVLVINSYSFHFKSQYELLKNLHGILKQPCAQCKVSKCKACVKCPVELDVGVWELIDVSRCVL